MDQSFYDECMELAEEKEKQRLEKQKKDLINFYNNTKEQIKLSKLKEDVKKAILSNYRYYEYYSISTIRGFSDYQILKDVFESTKYGDTVLLDELKKLCKDPFYVEVIDDGNKYEVLIWWDKDNQINDDSIQNEKIKTKID